jgi:hypothetical protein
VNTGAIAGSILVASKIVAALELPIMALGYLFFLSSHRAITHLYFFVTVIALVATIAISPRLFRVLGVRIAYALIAGAGVAFGVWKIKEHLEFFEGPEYDAAAMVLASVLSIIGAYGSSQYFYQRGSDT